MALDLDSVNALPTPAALFVIGIVAHLSIVSKEIDNHQWHIIGGELLSFAAIVGYQFLARRLDLWQSFLYALVGMTTFNIGFLFSTLVHRVCFHRLNKFPGPLVARLSSFYIVYLAARRLRFHLELEDLHEKYGDVVRIAPRQLSIRRGAAVKTIYGLQSKCTKGSWYTQSGNHPGKANLNQTRDKLDHKLRRRVWDRALGIKALSGIEPRIQRHLDTLMQRLRAHEGEPIDIAFWANMFSFDAMGEVGFSKDFNMLTDEKEHQAVKALHDSMVFVATMTHVPWLMQLMGTIPGMTAVFEKFGSWCGQQVRQKQDTFDAESEPSDICSWLLKGGIDNQKPLSQTSLDEDARLIIVAGSDTTAATLANSFYYLARHPQVYKHLQQDLDKAFPLGDVDWTYSATASIPYLDAIINEVLRLQPAVPSGVQRETPPEGVDIDELHIPGNVLVRVPLYVLSRDSRWFEDPLEFRPERWMDDSPVKTDKAAYAPFLIGPYSCAGKGFAMTQLRSVLSRVAINYDLAYPPGEDGEEFANGRLDTFTMSVPKLRVVLKSRHRQ